jgi:integrase
MRVLRQGPVKITRTVAETAWRQRAPGQRTVVADAECPGLALVVNSGSMSWTYSYKPRGTNPNTGKRFSTRSITIGNPQTHSPDDARSAAALHKGANKTGKDPATERKSLIAATAAKRGRTMGLLLESYADVLPRRKSLRGHGVLSPRHISGELSNLRAAVDEMGCTDWPADDVGVADVRKMLRATAHRPGAARHRFGALSRFFDWVQDEGHVATNPCLLLARPSRPRAVPARDAFLTVVQMARLWIAAGRATGLYPVHRDFVRFLIAIPCRRGEATTMDWSHVDLYAATWSQPGRLTKNREPHRLSLHPLALDILKTRNTEAGSPQKGLVFPSPRTGSAVQTFSDIRMYLSDAAPEVPVWRFHDFRRSFATTLGEMGISETVADAVLNHRQSATRGGVLGVYQRALRWPDQVEAMTAWGGALDEAIRTETAIG